MCDIENIPTEMKEHNIFCCWKEEMKDGKKTKVPYNARTGSRATPNDLSTFSSYSEAVKIMHNSTGLSFIVSHDICAVDLDDCVNEARELNEIAQNVIAYFPNTYIEKSPSGNGLHIYFKVSNFDNDTDIYYINNRKLRIEVKESKTAQETVYQKLKRRENDAKQASHQVLHCVHHSENKSTSSR